MYEPIAKAMQSSSLYSGKADVKVFDTHALKDFPVDITVAEYEDERLVYSLLYFAELKLEVKGVRLDTADHCGQVLDYCHKAREKQPDRQIFIGILSNFGVTFVFAVRYERDIVLVDKRLAPSLADAIIYADTESRKYYKRMRAMDPRLEAPSSILGTAKNKFVLQVPEPKLESIIETPPSASNLRTRQQIKSSQKRVWLSPRRHHVKRGFALKTVARDQDEAIVDIKKEIEILRMIRDAECINVPELVWDPDGDEFGIAPVGRVINFEQVSWVSEKIVGGLVDGLEWLHKKGLIHRDIRPSNLVLDDNNNVVIIDYETAITLEGKPVDYLGGFVCWPKRLLEARQEFYVPEPADDLFASILVVLHMLFHSQFESVASDRIGPGEPLSRETQRLLELWGKIENSIVWGIFYKAAERCDYETLRRMGDVFCHFDP
jgi:hypothetical protein